jgi:hypothetical protein
MSHIMWPYTKISSQGTFSNGLYVTPLVTVGFRHKILFMTLYALYMTISFCHENQFFCSEKRIINFSDTHKILHANGKVGRVMIFLKKNVFIALVTYKIL